MRAKKYMLLAIALSINFLIFSQSFEAKSFQIVPYAGYNSPLGDFKNFAKNGFVAGLSVDKYLNSHFALGLDFNYQSGSFKPPYNFSGISSSYSILEKQNGNWKTSTITFGPTYKMGTKKFTTEIYSKAGISYTKSPNDDVVLASSSFSKSIFSLPKQKRTSFGLTSGIRFNYSVSDRVSLFVNPQYIYSSSKVEYCNCGLDNLNNPDLIINQELIKEKISPSFINVNAGIRWHLNNKTKTTDEESTTVTRSMPPICNLSFVKLECSDADPILQLSMFWNNFDPNFTRTIEIYSGTTLVNPTSSSPQALSQNYGNIPFHSPISVNLVGANLSATIKIYDTNGVLVCNKTINFTVPQCSPPPPDCSFDIDFNNVTCDSDFITYNVTGTWSNINVGSFIEVEAKTNTGNRIPITILPARNAQINITASNTNGTFTSAISIPYSYNGVPISLLMKIKEPTTGYEKSCGISDLITPQCTTCDWTYTTTCDSATNGIKINVATNWSNLPTGCTLNYTLTDPNGGTSIPFTILPNNLPQAINANGRLSHTLFLGSNFSGSQLILKMEILDSDGTLLCNKVEEIKPAKCCEICSDLKITDTTIKDQKKLKDFAITGTITRPSSGASPITKIVAQLESISLNKIGTNNVTISNCEFVNGDFYYASGTPNAINADLVGSIVGNRSNLIIANLNQSTALPITFRLYIDGFDYGRTLRVMNYSIKLTIFKKDGTYCEKIFDYKR